MADGETGRGPAARGEAEIVEAGQLGEAHARRVAEAKATVPHLYLESLASLGAAEVRTEHLVRACATALLEFPRLNGSYRDGRFVLHARVNVGVALPPSRFMLFGTIHDAAEKDVAAIATELAALSARAASGELTQPELSGATFSLADLSGYGISRGLLPVSRGQAATLAVGAPDPGTRSLGLSADNRIVQADDGAGFLSRLSELLAALA